jgi:hypothetical protein
MKTLGALLLLWVSLCTGGQPEREPNDGLGEAMPLARGRRGLPDFVNGRHWDGLVQRARLEPGDVDYFSLAARAGDVLTVSLFETGRGEFEDPVIAVFGPGDDEPLALDDDGGPGFLPQLAVPVDRTGVWTIAVAGFGDAELDGGDHDAQFPYELVVAVAMDAASVQERDVAGGNDTPARAEPLSLLPGKAVVVDGALAPGDTDHFFLPLPPHLVLTASLYDDAAGEFNDSRMTLVGLAGDELAEDDDSGPGFLSNLAVESHRAPGGAVLVVTGFDPDPDDDRGHEQGFPYRLVLSLEPPRAQHAGVPW